MLRAGPPRPVLNGIVPTARIGVGRAAPPTGSLIEVPAGWGGCEALPLFSGSGKLLSGVLARDGVGVTGSETEAGRSRDDGLATEGRMASGAAVTAGEMGVLRLTLGELVGAVGFFTSGGSTRGEG